MKRILKTQVRRAVVTSCSLLLLTMGLNIGHAGAAVALVPTEAEAQDLAREVWADVSRLIAQEKLNKAKKLSLEFAARADMATWNKIRVADLVVRAYLNSGGRAKAGIYLDALKDTNVTAAHFLRAFYIAPFEDKLESAKSALWIAQQEPALLDRFTVTKYWAIIRALTGTEYEKYIFSLLQLLEEEGYAGGPDYIEPEWLYVRLVREYLKRDDIDAALAIAQQQFTSPEVLITLWHDRRYEALWLPLELAGFFNPDHMLDVALKTAEARSIKAREHGLDQMLRANTYVAERLRENGRPAEAARLAERLRALVPGDKYKHEFYAWLSEELASAKRAMGKTDEALAILAEVAAEDPNDYPNVVNQIINYGAQLHDAGRFEQALATLDRVLVGDTRYVSKYGRYWALSYRACSLQALGDKTSARAAYAEMQQDASVNYQAITLAGLCLGDDDYVAALYSERLENEDYRSDALDALSRYTVRPPSDVKAELEKRQEAIAARADVQAAVAKYGRSGQWDLMRFDWTSF